MECAKSIGFHQLLGEVGFSHNTLRLHLERLVDKGLVLKQKKSKKEDLGRPMFSYSLLPTVRRHISHSS
jgi:predicted ArsR family transcriptional regulator